MGLKMSFINCPKEPVMIEMIAEAWRKKELLKEFTLWLEDHGVDCIDGKSKFCKTK